jgi:hypothetical protein
VLHLFLLLLDLFLRILARRNHLVRCGRHRRSRPDFGHDRNRLADRQTNVRRRRRRRCGRSTSPSVPTSSRTTACKSGSGSADATIAAKGSCTTLLFRRRRRRSLGTLGTVDSEQPEALDHGNNATAHFEIIIIVNQIETEQNQINAVLSRNEQNNKNNGGNANTGCQKTCVFHARSGSSLFRTSINNIMTPMVLPRLCRVLHAPCRTCIGWPASQRTFRSNAAI